jgi:hypothetical protein
VVGADHRRPAALAELHAHEVTRDGAARSNRYVGFAAREIDEANGRVDLHLDPRMLHTKANQSRRHERLGEAGRYAEPHGSLGLALEARSVARETRMRRRHFFGRRKKQLGALRRREPFGRAIEETRAERFFQSDEAPAQRRRVEPDHGGGAGERASAVEREEDANVVPTGLGGGLHECNHGLKSCALSCVLASFTLSGIEGGSHEHPEDRTSRR